MRTARKPWNLPGHTVVNFDNYGSDKAPYGYVYFNDNTRVLYASNREVLLRSVFNGVITVDDIQIAKRGVFVMKGQWGEVSEKHIEAAESNDTTEEVRWESADLVE